MNRALPSRGLAFVAPHVAHVRFRSDGLANQPIPASVRQERQESTARKQRSPPRALPGGPETRRFDVTG